MTRWLAELIDRFLNSIAPLKNLDAADMLADLEAERDAFEPDELWAARMAKTQTPADTRRPGNPPRLPDWRNPPTGVGGTNLYGPTMWRPDKPW